jgi:hypothetical protein
MSALVRYLRAMSVLYPVTFNFAMLAALSMPPVAPLFVLPVLETPKYCALAGMYVTYFACSTALILLSEESRCYSRRFSVWQQCVLAVVNPLFLAFHYCRKKLVRLNFFTLSDNLSYHEQLHLFGRILI